MEVINIINMRMEEEFDYYINWISADFTDVYPDIDLVRSLSSDLKAQYPSYLQVFLKENKRFDCIKKDNILNLMVSPRAWDNIDYNFIRESLKKANSILQGVECNKLFVPVYARKNVELDQKRLHTLCTNFIKKEGIEIIYVG